MTFHLKKIINNFLLNELCFMRLVCRPNNVNFLSVWRLMLMVVISIIIKTFSLHVSYHLRLSHGLFKLLIDIILYLLLFQIRWLTTLRLTFLYVCLLMPMIVHFLFICSPDPVVPSIVLKSSLIL